MALKSTGNIQSAAWLGLGLTAVLLAGVILVTQYRLAHLASSTTNDPSVTLRTQYADLYAASSRDDQGRGSVVMSATIFTPALVSLLDRDADRSETETQMLRIAKSAPNTVVPIFLTTDSVAGPLSDQAIKESLQLTVNNKQVAASDWQPIILPSKSSDSGVVVNSQAGFAFFTLEASVDWTALSKLTLVSRNITDQPVRTFVWADISPLLATPE